MNRPKKIQCGACGRRFLKITKAHLDIHNMTVEQYRAIYGELSVPEAASNLMKKGKKSKREMLAVLFKDDDAKAMLEDGVAGYIFHHKSRGGFLLSASAITVARMAKYEKLVRIKHDILKDVDEEWRTNPDGTRASVQDILKVFTVLGMEQSAAENTIVKLIAQSISERKSPMQLIIGSGGGVAGRGYTGSFEALPPMTKEQRDQVRLIDECLMEGSTESVARALLMSGVLSAADYKVATGKDPDPAWLKNAPKVIDVQKV